VIQETTARVQVRADEYTSAGCMPQGANCPRLIVWGSVLVELTRNDLRIGDQDVAFARQLAEAAQEFLEATERLRDEQEAAAWAEARGGGR
jgi:hypothetical protein